MVKRIKKPEFPNDLFTLMQSFDDPDSSDSEWMMQLMDVVEVYNERHGTKYDPQDAFLAYCENVSAF